MDQSGQNPNSNGADVSSLSPNTTQRLALTEHSRQLLGPLAAIARPEPNLLWPSQSFQSYTQMHPNMNMQNVSGAPYLTGNIPNVHAVSSTNQNPFAPYSSTSFGPHYIMRQPVPYHNQATYPFNSYPRPSQTIGHVSSSGPPAPYPQNQIASSPYYNNGVGAPFISESSLAGALSHTRAVNDNQNQVTSNNAGSETLGRARVNDSIHSDARANNRGLEDALSKKDPSLQSLDVDSINLSVLDEVFRDDTWTNEASSRIVQTFLAPGNTTNTTGKETFPVSVPVLVNSSSVIVPTSSIGPSNSLQANQIGFLSTPEPSRNPPTPLDVMRSRIPQTPQNNQQSHVLTTPSSGSANRATLARDILRALQPTGLKRKRLVNEDHSSVVVSGKKSKTGDVDHPSLSDVVPPGSSIPSTSTPVLNDLSVQISKAKSDAIPHLMSAPFLNEVPGQTFEAKSDAVPHSSSTPLTPTPSLNDVPVQTLGAKAPEPLPICTSSTTTRVDREISPLITNLAHEILNHPPNQPETFTTGSKDLPPLPPSDVFDIEHQPSPPLSSEIQLGQPATEFNNVLPSSPQSTRSVSVAKVPTPFDIPTDAEKQSDRLAVRSSNLPPPSASSVKVKVRTPLFLPSDSSSPARQRSPEWLSDNKPSTSGKEVIYIDDDEPSQTVSSTGVITVRPNIRPYVLIPRLRSLFVKGKKKTVMAQPSGRGKRAVESEFPEVRDSRSRLTIRRCLWQGCSAILDSAEKLIKHTKVVHGNIGKEGIYKCQWTDCRLGTYFTSEDLKRHLKGHVQLLITCPYKGCLYETKRGDGLANHMATRHNPRQDTLRPLAIPRVRSTPQYVESIQIRPAYYSIPIPVVAKQISRERHSRLEPSIRKQIIGNYKPEKHKLKTIASARDPSSLMADDYDFQQEEPASRTFSSLRQVSPIVNDIDVLEGNVSDSVVIMEMRFDGSPLPETASDVKAGSPRTLDDGLGIDLGPNILQTVREEHESLEVESLL